MSLAERRRLKKEEKADAKKLKNKIQAEAPIKFFEMPNELKTTC